MTASDSELAMANRNTSSGVKQYEMSGQDFC